MPSYTIYEDVCCSVDEVQTLSRTCLEKSSSAMISSSMSSSKSIMMNNNYNQQQYTSGKMMSSSKQNTKATLGCVDLNVHPHLLTCGPNKENIDPLTGRVYPMPSSSIFNNSKTNPKNHCTTNIRDPLKDITLSVLGQTTQQQPRLKKLTSSSSLQTMMTPQKNKRNASVSTGSLNPLSPSTLYLR